MKKPVSSRAVAWVLPALALLGALVRLWPFLGGSALAYPMDYDEGVYFSAAGLLFRGVLPYRDFVFVHPPGLLWFLGISAAWPGDPAHLFAVSRFVAAGLGGVSVYLAGRVAQRGGGLVSGTVAAVLYALYPEAVGVERGPFLEPVLNLSCLAFANAWLGGSGGETTRRWRWAGALLGMALSVKVWAGAWLLAGLTTPPRGMRWRASGHLALGIFLSFALLVMPLALMAPKAFVTQTLFFHALRPMDGTGGLARLQSIFSLGHRAATLLAAVALSTLPWRLRRGDEARTGRLFASAWLLTLLGFLLSPSYWSQYNAALAPCEAVLAGLGAQILWDVPVRRALPLRAVGLVGLALGLWQRPWRDVRRHASQRAEEQLALARVLREDVPPRACLFTLEPGWSLLGGRWPSTLSGVPRVVDSYGAQLLAAVQTGARYPSAGDAFADTLSQGPVRPYLEGCDYLVLGGRGEWQLSPASRLLAGTGRIPRPGGAGLVLWLPRR